MPGIWELLIVLAIVLLIFGAKRLPAVGDALGKTLRGFRRASRDGDALQASGKEAKELTAGLGPSPKPSD